MDAEAAAAGAEAAAAAGIVGGPGRSGSFKLDSESRMDESRCEIEVAAMCGIVHSLVVWSMFQLRTVDDEEGR